MSEHEFWNELGNLYFISGAYEPAIHAYARSIELERGFGRPYSNMALAFVHTGKYQDAIQLYQRSIELLSDAKEKAVTWNRLGILYRQIKDYQGALVAYEQADKLDSRQDEKREEASRDAKYPLTISMPGIDLKAILAKQEQAEIEDADLVQNLNKELEVAETQLEIDWFEGGFVPPNPNPVEEPMIGYRTEEDELLQDVNLPSRTGVPPLIAARTVSMEAEGWIPLVFEDAIPVNEFFQMGAEPTGTQTEESSSTTTRWQTQFEDFIQENKQNEAPAAGNEIPEENEKQEEAVNKEAASDYRWVPVNSFQVSDESEGPLEEGPSEVAESETTFENRWVSVNGFQAPDESVSDSGEYTGEDQAEVAENISDNFARGGESDFEMAAAHATNFEGQSVDMNEFDTGTDLNVHSMDVTEPGTLQYAQVEYPLVERSAAEIDSIQIDIARFKRIIQINPRNPFAYDTLGGLYKALGRFKDAITAYQQAIALDSTKPSYFYQLGLMYSAERRDQEAMDAFQRVLSINPQHTLAHASLGSHYRKMGLNDLAQQHIDIALKDVYEEENEYNQACLEAICGNADRALELLQVAIEDNPTYINWAQHDPDLDILRHDERFYMLIQSFAQNK